MIESSEVNPSKNLEEYYKHYNNQKSEDYPFDYVKWRSCRHPQVCEITYYQYDNNSEDNCKWCHII